MRRSGSMPRPESSRVFSMKILTLMDYDTLEGIIMCRGWFYLMKRFNPQAEITVLHAGKTEGFRQYAERLFPTVRFLEMDLTGIITNDDVTGFDFPYIHLTMARWRTVETHQELSKHLFIEADAWVIAPLDELWSVVGLKPFVATIEQYWYGGPLFNIGVYTYNNAGSFLSHSKIMQQLESDERKIHLPVGDQGLINSIIRRTRYDARHPKVGPEYNVPTGFATIERMDDDAIEISFGPRPLDLGPWSWLGGWAGWGERRSAKIVHSFWRKWWKVPETERLWRYVTEKVAVVE